MFGDLTRRSGVSMSAVDGLGSVEDDLYEVKKQIKQLKRERGVVAGQADPEIDSLRLLRDQLKNELGIETKPKWYTPGVAQAGLIFGMNPIIVIGGGLAVVGAVVYSQRKGRKK